MTPTEPPQGQHGAQPGSSTDAGLRSTGSPPEPWQPSGSAQRALAAQRDAAGAQVFPEGPPGEHAGLAATPARAEREGTPSYAGRQAREAWEARRAAEAQRDLGRREAGGRQDVHRREAAASQWEAAVAAPVPANALQWAPPVGAGRAPDQAPTAQSGPWSRYRRPTPQHQYTREEWTQWRADQWRAADNWSSYTWEQCEEWRAQQMQRRLHARASYRSSYRH